MRAISTSLLALFAALWLASCDQFGGTAPSQPAEPEDSEEPDTPEEPDEPEEPADPDADVPDDEFLTDDQGRTFSYVNVGDLLPNTGPGNIDTTIYRPDIQFPLEDDAFLNSQVYRYGGSKSAVTGMTGSWQCDGSNYDYPWQDTFCESRSREQIMCPNGGHEGVDIRPATCIPQTHNTHWAVAVEDGRVIAPSSSKYTVRLQTEDGTLYRYLHLKMDELAVTDGQYVTKGQRIGKVSNVFYNSSGSLEPTTYHLHFEMYQNYAPDEVTDPVFDQVNPYMTLVNAYEKKLRGE
ncbi:MAG: M23 family metallopeptidase [Parvularculaceae bacterium]